MRISTTTAKYRRWSGSILLLSAIALLACALAYPSHSAADSSGARMLTFQGQGMTIVLATTGDGDYTGTIEANGARCPFTAHATGATLEGTFTDSSGHSFSFTATQEQAAEGTVLTLTTGGKTYRMTQLVDAPQPPAQQPSAQNPPAQPTPAPQPAPPAQPPPQNPEGGEHTYTVTPDAMLTLMPELKNAPAPAWVKPGMRFIMHRMDGVIVDSRVVLVAAANGGWVNKATGQRFNFDENIGGAGDGLLEVDVVAMHNDCAVLNAVSYVYNGMQRVLTLSNAWGVVTTPSVSACWINPEVLHKYADINGPGVESYKTKYTAINKTFTALWRSVGDAKSNTTEVTDLDSGLRLHDAMCTITDPSTVNINGLPQNVGGQTNVAQGTLVELRQLNSPWTQGKLPVALTQLHHFVYDGAQYQALPNGMPLPPAPMHIVLTITGRGSDFAQIHREGTLNIGGAISRSAGDFVTGPAELSAQAVDPQDLAKLHQGQVLDTDPVTQIVTAVTFVGRANDGNDVVVITSAVPGDGHHHSDAVYDRSSGLLVGFSLNNPFLNQVVRMKLTSTD